MHKGYCLEIEVLRLLKEPFIKDVGMNEFDVIRLDKHLLEQSKKILPKVKVRIFSAQFIDKIPYCFVLPPVYFHD